MDTEYFTVAEAAKKLKVTPQAIYKWIAQGKLQAVYVGSDRRVTSEAIKEFVQNSTKAAKIDDPGTIETDTRMPSLAAA